MENSLEETILVKITVDDIKFFQDNVGIPFVSTLKANISVTLAHKMWHPPSVYLTQRKHPSYIFHNYGKDSLSILLYLYGLPRTALSLNGEEFQKQALITDEVYAEWTTFRHYTRNLRRTCHHNYMIFQQMKCSNQCSSICVP